MFNNHLKQLICALCICLSAQVWAGFPGNNYNTEKKMIPDWYSDKLSKDAYSPEVLLNDLENIINDFDSKADYRYDYETLNYSLANSERIVEKRKEDILKNPEEKSNDRLKSLEKRITEVRNFRKQKFWESINQVLSDENKLDFNNAEEMLEVIKNFFIYLKSSSLKDIKEVRDKDATGLIDNDLHKAQKRFLQLSAAIVSGEEAPRDKLISTMQRKDPKMIAKMLKCIISNSTWNKEDQLTLLSNFNEIKRIFVRSGYGFVRDGKADSIFLIPILNTIKHLYPQYFLYGEPGYPHNGYIGNGFDVTYVKEEKIGDIRLRIYDEVIKKMKEFDEKWYSLRAEPCGDEYFKGRLANLRCFISNY